MTDQYHHWRLALQGTPVDSEVGRPRAGFWMAPNNEAIAIWYEDDTICCERQKFDGSRMRPDQIDQLYASASRYPIEEKVYRAVAERGEPWPPEYKTRLSLAECQANIVWSPELGRKKLGAAAKADPAPPADTPADNPRAVIGDNNPPEETPVTGHKIDGEQTPDKLAFAEVSTLAHGVKIYLDGIGGKPRAKAEADALADYATKFKELSKKAEAARTAEKKPHLDAEREIDARWKRPRDLADGSRKRCLEISQAWREAEDARRAEEVRKANEHAAAEAEKAGRSKPEPIQAERVGGLGNIKTVGERTDTTWVVVDPKAYLTHLLSRDGEIPAEIVEAAEKVAKRRGEEAPGVEKRTERKAA